MSSTSPNTLGCTLWVSQKSTSLPLFLCERYTCSFFLQVSQRKSEKSQCIFLPGLFPSETCKGAEVFWPLWTSGYLYPIAASHLCFLCSLAKKDFFLFWVFDTPLIIVVSFPTSVQLSFLKAALFMREQKQKNVQGCQIPQNKLENVDALGILLYF